MDHSMSITPMSPSLDRKVRTLPSPRPSSVRTQIRRPSAVEEDKTVRRPHSPSPLPGRSYAVDEEKASRRSHSPSPPPKRSDRTFGPNVKVILFVIYPVIIGLVLGTSLWFGVFKHRPKGEEDYNPPAASPPLSMATPPPPPSTFPIAPPPALPGQNPNGTVINGTVIPPAPFCQPWCPSGSKTEDEAGGMFKKEGRSWKGRSGISARLSKTRRTPTWIGKAAA